MALFEFIIILKSIVIGLAMAQVLTGFASSLRDPDLHRPYWVHTVLVASIFLVLIQVWWETWPLSRVPVWRFSTLVLLLLPSVALYLVAHLLYPRHDAAVDLRDYYFDKRRPIFTLVILTTVTSTLIYPVAFGVPILVAENIQSAVIIVFALTLALSTNRAIHSVLVPAGLLATALDIPLSPWVAVG